MAVKPKDEIVHNEDKNHKIYKTPAGTFDVRYGKNTMSGGYSTKEAALKWLKANMIPEAPAAK